MPYYFNLFFITSITSSCTFPLLITAPLISVSYLCSSPNKLVTLPHIEFSNTSHVIKFKIIYWNMSCIHCCPINRVTHPCIITFSKLLFFSIHTMVWEFFFYVLYQICIPINNFFTCMYLIFLFMLTFCRLRQNVQMY